MPTPVISASTRYMDLGITKVYYLPTIAATTLIPTRTEMNAGRDLSPELGDWSGWTLSPEFLDTQNITSAFKTNIPGSLSSPPCTMTFYTSRNGTDVRAVLPPGTAGFIMFCDGGDVTGNKAEVWPILVGSNSVLRNPPGAGTASSTPVASLIFVEFANTGAPAQLVPIP